MAEEAQYATLKRKYDDQPTATDIELEVANAKQRAQEVAARLLSVTGAPPLSYDPKRTKSDNGAPHSGFDSYDLKPQYSQQGGSYGSSKKIEIPNGRVGVLIGKGGETIKYLQMQSGAKIQVTRDMDADPNSQTRMVELMGTPDAVSSAEKLINEVLAEAEAGASGGGTRRMVAQSGGDEFVMQIPNNKVGLIIGKGGETIKSMQASTGARIQVIPLHPPPGDTSTERTLKIDGTPDQIESAKQLVNQILTGENRLRNSGNSGGYTQQGYQSRPPSSWAPPPAPVQQAGYGYGQPGSYSGPSPQYNMPQPPYAGYPPQQPGGYSANWDQSTAPSHQQSTHASGYDYYNQQPQQQQNPGGPPQPADGSGYSYSQPPSSGYSQPGQGYGQESYGAYNAQQQSGYGQPQTYDQQQGYGSAPSYGSGSNPTQEGHTSNYGSQADTSQTSQPTTVAQQGYATNQPETPQPGYAVAPTTQAAYGSQPQSGYGPSYGAPPSQKPSANPPVYGQSQSPSTAGGYGHSAYPSSQAPPSGYAQPELGTQRAPVQPGYGPQSYGAPQGGQPGYGQTPPSYGNSSYGGSYAQAPAYASDGATAQAVPQGSVAKVSPKS
ncbi:putative K domain-containing protein [Medicago truncatula]|uniref:Putative K domain-containing protein n=1 Tax=Medicago truncatula TaxID=3880 RepID=G7J7L8_MEDTR|nr:far upstream element-binding protein 1 [Medicago truncatula]AES73389.2 RNA-binding KH domain protein [Medicago truncatula]RHN70448.1 putative K domain-containing protein [Medicago truncatula]